MTPHDLPELVVVILLVLVFLMVMATLLDGGARITVARRQIAQTQLDHLADLIIKIKGFSEKASVGITGGTCSDCACRTGGPVDRNPECVRGWLQALHAFEALGKELGLVENLAAFATDAFGSPFLLDENDDEPGSCARDTLRSAGPDKVWGTADDLFPYGKANYIININAAPGCAGR